MSDSSLQSAEALDRDSRRLAEELERTAERLAGARGAIGRVIFGQEAVVEQTLITLLAVLGASASYIAVPAAMRVALPQANATLSMAASLGITFPFNVLAGIPLYLLLAQWLHGS